VINDLEGETMKSRYLLQGCCRRSSISLAVLSALGAVETHAQQTKGSETLEEVVVTSTGTNISGVAPVGSETVTIDREDMLATGASNLAEVVRSLPQVQSLGFDEASRDNNAALTTNPTRGTAINLRGIGQNATLLLVDGHRLTPAGTSNSYTEAIQLPMAAVERIEVIADGASAVYGSDAVSGVVNFVLRKDFEGLEAAGRYGTNSYGSDWSASLLGGTSWEGFGPLGRGNVIVGYEHFEQEAVLRGDLPWFRQDLTSFGGIDNRVAQATATAGASSNIVVSTTPIGAPPNSGPRNPVYPEAGLFTIYGLPQGTNGQGLTLNDLLVNQPNLGDRAGFEDYLPDTKREHVTLFVDQEITPWLSAYYQGFYSERDSFTRLSPSQIAGTLTVSLPPTLVQPDGSTVPNPNYVSGIPNTVGPMGPQPLTVQYNLVEHLPPGISFGNVNDEETFSHTAGLRARLPGEWNADFYYTYGSVENCGVCIFDVHVNLDAGGAFQRAINEGFINPLSTERLTQAQWDRVNGDNLQQTQNRLNDAVLKFDGPLFGLPAGKVRIAVGGEYTEHNNKLQNGGLRSFTASGGTPAYGARDEFLWDADADNTRYQRAAFTELYVPVVGPEQGVPLVRAFDLSAALRYDDFSDFGDTTNPKIGFTWALTEGFSLRGSWGTSFRAPGLPESDNGVFSFQVLAGVFPNNSGDAGIPTVFPGFSSVVLRIGGNPDLEPEEGTTWSVGFDWLPELVEGFKVSGTYYRIEYDSRIVTPNLGSFLASPANRQIYAPYITATPAVAGCTRNDRSTWNADVRDAFENPLIPHIGRSFLYGIETFTSPANDPCAVRAILDGRNTNAATTVQNGFDLQIGYSFQALQSFWNLGVSASKILKNEQTLLEGLPTEDVLDRIMFPVDLSARANINWSRGDWNASWFANYVDGYRNDLPISIVGVPQSASDVPSWTTMDLNVGYRVPTGAGYFLDGLQLNVNVRNLLDRDPPVVLSGQNAMDARNHNPFGRSFQFNLTKRF
jgi:iron complex outermembrane receptor protein